MDYSNKKAKTLLNDIKEKKSVRIQDESGVYYVNYKSVLATAVEGLLTLLGMLGMIAVMILLIIF